jgi:hypothetical protein
MLEEYFGSSSTLQRNERVKLAAMFWNIVGAGMLIGGVTETSCSGRISTLSGSQDLARLSSPRSCAASLFERNRAHGTLTAPEKAA